ncbi:MAG: N-formylglutamate amidohydrolase [Lachnospiraceae bacterium]|nr:N-formylglutamate amidohydrolase [Lachnospiraceae bacterium]
MQKNDPVIIHVPHASTLIPKEERRHFVTCELERELAVMTDHYCDDLYDTGAEMVRFPISRLICDPERFRDDADESMSEVGMGAVYTKCSDGTPLKNVTKRHREEILRTYYDVHHKRLEDAVLRKLEECGTCLILDGHSFYEKALPYEPDQRQMRPEICIGTDEVHTPKPLADMLCAYFLHKGYTVAVNRPFAGAIVPLRFYRTDPRVHAVMIEVNRGLYMDHDLRKTEGYERVRQDLAEAVEMLREGKW